MFFTIFFELYKFEEHSFIMNSDRSNLVNLKGEKINYNVPSGFQFKTVYQENESIFLVFSKENELLVLNQSAQFQWKRGINCSSIDKVVIPQLKTSNNSSKIILGILDGIENKILLLDSQGTALDNVKRHGEKKVVLIEIRIKSVIFFIFRILRIGLNSHLKKL